MENLHRNMLMCLKFIRKHRNMHIFMYFLHLVSPFTFHYIIIVFLNRRNLPHSNSPSMFSLAHRKKKKTKGKELGG